MPQLDSLGNESMLHTRVRPHYICRHLRPPGSILVANSCFIHRHTRLHYANGGAVHYSAAGGQTEVHDGFREPRCQRK